MNSKAFLLVCFLLSFVALTIVSASLSEKTEELRRQALRSPTGVIEVSADQYQKYVLESPRPYDVVVFYTAQSCNFCDKIYTEYKLAASFYRDSGALYSQKINDERKRAVFFLVISYSEQAHEIFKNMNFVSIPNIAVLPPKIAHMSSAEQMMIVKSLSWQISYTDGHVTSHKLLEFINKRTTRNVEYKESVFNILLVLSVFTAIGFGLYFLFVKFRFIFVNNKLWLVGSLIIYVICMSGFIYNILHDIPLTMTDKKGNLQWMTTHEGRSQLGAEGLIMSISIAFAGLLIFAASKIFKKMETDMLSRALFVVLLIGSFFLINFVEDIYASKSHYKIRFWPPSTYVKGPLINDQGNSI